MPLIRRGPPPAAEPDEPPGRAALTAADPSLRREAARALGEDRGAVAALAAALCVEADTAVREAQFSSLIRIGGDAAAAALLPLLRSDDPALRMGAVEALQAMPEAAAPHLPGLLADDDADLRLLAAEVARGLPAAAATVLLAERLPDETHPNVAGAIVDVLAEIGTAAALPALATVAERFAGTPFLAYAAEAAQARIRGR